MAAGGHLATIEPRAAAVVGMLGAHQQERMLIVDALAAHIEYMVRTLRPGLELPPHWMADAPLPQDTVDRARFHSDELRVLSVQMAACQPWATPAGRLGLATCSDDEQHDEAARVVGIFGELVALEVVPLHRLERAVKRLQLSKQWHGERAIPLATSVEAMRQQHVVANHVMRLLEKALA